MTAELICSASDPAWLERRREGITATDIVTIAGLVTWDSPWALYHRKLGLLPELEETWRMRRGSFLERALTAEWAARAISANGDVWEGGLYRNTSRSWQLATPDRIIAYDNPIPHGTLECKSTQQRQGWGADGTDQVPAHVRAQVLWQMDTLGVGTGHVAADVCGEFRSYTIRGMPDSTIHEVEIDRLRALGREFWQRLQDRRPPDLDGLEVTTDALRYLHPAPGGQVELEPVDGLLQEYDANQATYKGAEVLFKITQARIRLAMGDAHEATVGGRVVFRRSISKRAGYYVQPGETDTLRRIGKDKD